MKTLYTAQYVVNTFSNWRGGVTPLKLQKLLYYIKAWGIVADENLFPGDFRKWMYGPVNKNVYNNYREYGRNPIPYIPLAKDHEPKDKEKELIDFIGTCYAPFNPLTLSAMTHKEDPWRLTEKDHIIPPQLLLKYYSKQSFAKNFPFDADGKPFYPVQSDLDCSFTMDMSKRDAKRITVYESYNTYLEHLKRASGEFDKWFNRLLA